jgi:hypothetical protein
MRNSLVKHGLALALIAAAISAISGTPAVAADHVSTKDQAMLVACFQAAYESSGIAGIAVTERTCHVSVLYFADRMKHESGQNRLNMELAAAECALKNAEANIAEGDMAAALSNLRPAQTSLGFIIHNSVDRALVNVAADSLRSVNVDIAAATR